MNSLPRGISLAVIVALVTGCRTGQLRDDQDRFRTAMLAMETNQIMDNLVRAKMGLPIVHIDYDRITGTVTQVGSGDIRASFTDVVGGAFTRMMSGTLTVRQDKQLSVIGSPVRDNLEVYLAYLRFVELPDGIVISPEPPPDGAAHIWKCCNGIYYWVPIHRRGDFFELAMRVTALRGQAIQAPEGYEVVIDSVTEIFPVLQQEQQPEPGTSFELMVKFKSKLPNDSGSANITLIKEGGSRVFPVEFLSNDRPSEEDRKEGVTDTLKLIYVFGNDVVNGEIPIDPRNIATQLRNQPITLFFARHRPQPPTRDQLLRQIRDELNAIRMHQLREP